MREHFVPIQLNTRVEELFRIHNCGNCKGFEPLIQDGRVLEEGYVIQLITKGRGVFASESGNFVGFEGETLILSHPGVWQAFGPQPGTAMEHTYVHFSGKLPVVLLEGLKGQDRDIIPLKVNKLYRRSFSEIGRLVQLKSRKALHQAHALTYELIMETIFLFQNQMPLSRRPIIDEFMTYMSEQLQASELDLEGFLKTRGISRAKFSRLLKKETDSTPHQLWLDHKVGEAQSLLIKSELSVKEIAKALGFRDEFYFSRLFKKKEGVSPTQYRRQF
jgi:AraC-like DNA-binding protein